MNTVRGTCVQILIAGALAVLVPPAVAAPRVLIEAEDAQVIMGGELRCAKDAEVTVLARDPALFGGDSTRLQSLLDATHALLGFECRNLPGMMVDGRLNGIESIGYQAVAGPAGDWRLQPSRTMQVSSPAVAGRPATSSKHHTNRAGVADFAVRELRRGMSLQDALAAARAGFASEPGYDANQHLLSVVEGRCPFKGESLRRESTLRAGDVCLEAKFIGERPEQLDRLSFGQVVDNDQSATIRGELERRYGPPVRSSELAPSTIRLGWGRPLPGVERRHELEALIDVRDTTTVLVLQLQGAEQAPQYKIDF